MLAPTRLGGNSSTHSRQCASARAAAWEPCLEDGGHVGLGTAADTENGRPRAGSDVAGARSEAGCKEGSVGMADSSNDAAWLLLLRMHR